MRTGRFALPHKSDVADFTSESQVDNPRIAIRPVFGARQQPRLQRHSESSAVQSLWPFAVLLPDSAPPLNLPATTLGLTAQHPDSQAARTVLTFLRPTSSTRQISAIRPERQCLDCRMSSPCDAASTVRRSMLFAGTLKSNGPIGTLRTALNV